MSEEPERYEIIIPDDDHILRISSGLAQEIGFLESIVLLQLEALISRSPYHNRGHFVTFQGARQLNERYFPWMPEQVIEQIIAKLENEGFISTRDDGRFHDDVFISPLDGGQLDDRDSWCCALNYGRLEELDSIQISVRYCQMLWTGTSSAA